ncbi:hypothetical protein THOM_2011 [Trachipleistophora hominis]|uniref:Uncharacterized protein n=1 Tax=Trachipleistophora hominis TaxID=72359 RepID=L7JVF6_TRAHO|nr:hypothetical protein THOM_2011 [Trachipleistophora hominis]
MRNLMDYLSSILVKWLLEIVMFGINGERRYMRPNYNEARREYRRMCKNKHTYNQNARRILGLGKVKIVNAKRDKIKQLRYYIWSRKRSKHDRTIYEDENVSEKRKRKSACASDNVVLMRVFHKKLVEMINCGNLMIGKANKKLLMMLFSIQLLIDYYKVGSLKMIVYHNRWKIELKRTERCYEIEEGE